MDISKMSISVKEQSKAHTAFGGISSNLERLNHGTGRR